MNTPTYKDLEAMRTRKHDADSITGALALLADQADPWAYVMVTPELNGCTLRYDELTPILLLLIIECGEERCIIHHLHQKPVDPEVARLRFSVLKDSRRLRAEGIQSIIEHWYTFAGAEELIGQAVNRVPQATLAAPEEFQATFPLLFDAATQD